MIFGTLVSRPFRQKSPARLVLPETLPDKVLLK